MKVIDPKQVGIVGEAEFVMLLRTLELAAYNEKSITNFLQSFYKYSDAEDERHAKYMTYRVFAEMTYNF